MKKQKNKTKKVEITETIAHYKFNWKVFWITDAIFLNIYLILADLPITQRYVIIYILLSAILAWISAIFFSPLERIEKIKKKVEIREL